MGLFSSARPRVPAPHLCDHSEEWEVSHHKQGSAALLLELGMQNLYMSFLISLFPPQSI